MPVRKDVVICLRVMMSAGRISVRLFLLTLTLFAKGATSASVAAAAFANPSPEWIAWQLAVGTSSYVGLVAWLDRPKGRLFSKNDLTVAPSQVPGAGMGLYASNTIPKGTILGTYPGVVMPLEQGLVKLAMAPRCETYIWRFSDSKFIIDPTDPQGLLEEYAFGGNPTTVGSVALCRTLLSVLKVPTTLCRINEPPVGLDRNVCTQEDLNNRVVNFVTERDVYAGEEFFIDYGLTYDRSGYR
jgi:hypothetical protein